MISVGMNESLPKLDKFCLNNLLRKWENYYSLSPHAMPRNF